MLLCTKGVFGRLGELRYSHLNLAQPTICCLLGQLVISALPKSYKKWLSARPDCEAQIELHTSPKLTPYPQNTVDWYRGTPRPPPASFSPSHFPHRSFLPSPLLSHRPSLLLSRAPSSTAVCPLLFSPESPPLPLPPRWRPGPDRRRRRSFHEAAAVVSRNRIFDVFTQAAAVISRRRRPAPSRAPSSMAAVDGGLRPCSPRRWPGPELLLDLRPCICSPDLWRRPGPELLLDLLDGLHRSSSGTPDLHHSRRPPPSRTATGGGSQPKRRQPLLMKGLD
jgi:hypothetical protein